MNKDRLKSFTERTFADMAGAMTAGLAYLGVKTGLFRAMAGSPPRTAAEIAAATGLEPRYVQEWLNGMAAARYLDYDPDRRTFVLPEEHAFLLASEGTDHYSGGLFSFVPPLLSVAPRVAEAFAKGGGVPFADYGVDAVQALAAMNAGQYLERFNAAGWLKPLPEIVAKLESGAQVLDVGCGSGAMVVSIATHFPASRVLGIDLDPSSIAAATKSAVDAGVSERTSFEVKSAGELDPSAEFDLVTICDCIHDLSAPERTLAEIRRHVRPNGTLYVIEPKAGDRLEDNMNPIGAMFYGFSMFHCMTQSLAHGGPGLGTCMGPAKLKELLQSAGFSRFESLPIRSQVLSFYAARP